jgi:hypothetical protein
MNQSTAADEAELAADKSPIAPRLTAGLPWKTLMYLTVGLALLIIMAEISRLSGSILDTAGQAWSFNELAGFLSFSSRAGWRADFTGAIRVRGIFLTVYVAADLAFIWVYWTLIRRFWKRRFDEGTSRNRRMLLLLLAVADVTEDVLAVGTIALRGQVTALWLLGDVLAVVNIVKSLACLAIAFVLIADLLTAGGRSARRSLLEIYQVIRQHRFTLVPLVLVSLVSIVPGADILDQVPDIVRRWTDGPRNFTVESGAALLALMVFAATLFVVGRMRTAAAARSWKESAVPPLPEAPLLFWLVVPFVIFLLGVVARLIGFPVGLVRSGIVCGVPFGIGVWSIALREINIRRGWANKKPATQLKPPTQWSADEIGLIMRTGDAIAVGLLVIGWLVVIRAIIAVILLAVTQSIEFNGFALVLLIIAAAGIGLTWPIASYALVHLSASSSSEREPVACGPICAGWFRSRASRTHRC